MLKSKLSAIVSLVLVFLSGALVGAVGNRLYMVNTVNSGPPRPRPEEVRRQLINETRQRLNLDDEQVRKLNEIYDEERQDFERFHQKFNAEGQKLRMLHMERIKQILTPDQIAPFEKLQAERDAAREAARKRRQQQMERK